MKYSAVASAAGRRGEGQVNLIRISKRVPLLPGLCGGFLSSTPVLADSDQELAKDLANPVASLISVPIDINFDDDLGPNNKGDRMTIVAKPVVPFSLNDDWNLITRTIIPYVGLTDFPPAVGDKSGLGDTQANFFLPPKATT